MPTMEHIWKCDVCGQVYLSDGDAQSCENKHTPLDAIKVVNIIYDNATNGFPLNLEVEVDGKESVKLLGTYELVKVYDTHNKELLYKRMKGRY